MEARPCGAALIPLSLSLGGSSLSIPGSCCLYCLFWYLTFHYWQMLVFFRIRTSQKVQCLQRIFAFFFSHPTQAEKQTPPIFWMCSFSSSSHLHPLSVAERGHSKACRVIKIYKTMQSQHLKDHNSTVSILELYYSIHNIYVLPVW